MTAFVLNQLRALQQLCVTHGVRRLVVFGSAVSSNFDPKSSDLDFAVEFQQLSPREHADAYFGLIEALERLFGTKVDLVEIPAVRNPYFLESINATQEVIYAA